MLCCFSTFLLLLTAMADALSTLSSKFYDPVTRMSSYERNPARFLVDLHDARGTFDFCGGMMFQLVLSDKLYDRLSKLSENDPDQPIVYDSSKTRMYQTPGYSKTYVADNKNYFHGREIRQVVNAAGGMGFVLQLSDSEGDPEGWSKEELHAYDGWGHDSGRQWRRLEQWEKEGVKGFRERFGRDVFGLNHRMYLHLDKDNHFWLSAEDGCEGKAAATPAKRGLFQFF